jgi:intracellular sulfur oxidation DsrE/DsrF family protein
MKAGAELNSSAGVVCLEYGAAPKKAASDRVADIRQQGVFFTVCNISFAVFDRFATILSSAVSKVAAC